MDLLITAAYPQSGSLRLVTIVSYHSSLLAPFEIRYKVRSPTYLGMDQGIIKENEPIHRKPACVLQGEGSVAALTQQAALWLPQGILGLKTDTTLDNQYNFNMQKENKTGKSWEQLVTVWCGIKLIFR